MSGRDSLVADLQEQLDRQTRELVDAREQQAATSEILRVISSSPTDVQPLELATVSGIRNGKSTPRHPPSRVRRLVLGGDQASMPATTR